MCQLLGMNCNTPTDIMFSFTGFATRAEEHKDGFGVAFFEGRGVRCLVDAASARVSPVARMIAGYPICSDNVVAHIRKATQGRVALENCHPFVRELWGRYWVFAHNGDLKDFAPPLHAAFRPVGDTDSERAFCWLMQEMNKAHADVPSVAELTTTLAELVPRVAAHGTFNFMLGNGVALWAHCSTNLHWIVRQHPFKTAHLQDEDLSVDFAQHTSPADRVAVIVTEPLTSDEAWAAFAPGELKVFEGGQPAPQVRTVGGGTDGTPRALTHCADPDDPNRPPTMPTPLQPRFDTFYRYDALTQLLFDYAAAHPGLVAVESIGQSHEGRDIWVVTLTNLATGTAGDKPAFWTDGNIHAAEVTASTAVLYYLHQLVDAYGTETELGRQVTQLLDTRAIYLCPRVNPDGAELALADRPRHIRSSTRRYPFDEAPVDGLTVEDIDGDGRVLSVRIPDPHGTYKRHPREPRLMVPREPGEFGGEYFRVIPEGTLKAFDGLSITVNRDPEGLDLNRNFPTQWRQEFEQVGAGPYPTSEPEVRAMVDFIVKHPNIGAAVSYHTHSGVILRPFGTHPDDEMIPEDLWAYQRFGEIAEKTTGYPAISIFHEFKYHPKEVITGTQDWIYEHLGALFWVVEIWAPNKEAGITDYKWIDWYRDHPVEDEIKLLKWSDEQCGGLAHVDWKPFHHPQLGAVEIGGWDRLNYWRNPPPHLREREAARFPTWMTQVALSLPRLELLRTEVRALGPDTWRVRLAVANSGWLPAYVSKRALARKVTRGVMFEIHLPEGDPAITLVGGKQRFEGPQLEGHAPKHSLHAFVQGRDVTADRAVAEWVVRAPQGTRLALSARADRAGAVRTEVSLD